MMDGLNILIDGQSDHKISNEDLKSIYGSLIKRTALQVKSKMPWADQEDLVQWGAVAMMEAIDRYNAETGIDFKYYAAQRIRGAMIDGLRKTKSFRTINVEHEHSSEDDGGYENGGGDCFEVQSKFNPLSELLQRENAAFLLEGLKQLTDREQQILNMFFYQDLNNREIAAIFNVDEAYTSRVRQKALLKLRDFMANKSGD